MFVSKNLPFIASFYWIYNILLFILKIGVSKEAIVILLFAHNSLPTHMAF